MTDDAERAREEFLSEAQELIEGLGRDILALDEAERSGHDDPESLNDLFRGVHTLKGLSGLFGASTLAGLAHELETLLDGLRLGKIQLSRRALDALFRALDRFTLLLHCERDGSLPPSLDDLLEEIQSLGQAPDVAVAHGDYALDAGLLGVLTEYEEHRLRTNLAHGMSLYRLRVEFELTSIDRELETLKGTAKPYGEIITYLPAGAGTRADCLELDVLMASKATEGELQSVFAASGAQVEELPRAASSRPAIAPKPIPAPQIRLAQPTPEPAPLPVSHTVAPSAPHSPAPTPVSDAERGRREDASLRSVANTVRVDISKLDALMNIVGELAIVKSGLGRLLERLRAQRVDRALETDILRLERDFERRLAAMQDGILEVRMVPLGQMFDKLSRVVRQISRDMDKAVNLVISGADTELDKLLVEELSDPLMHMMRNAIDHGIEGHGEREAVGKPPTGTIALNAFQKGNHVVLEVEDDGRGIDAGKLLETGLRLGFVTQEEARSMSPRDLINLVFLPGLSTRSDVSELSGRGVGMDVVKTNISKLGGVIDIHSELGIGTKITVTVPITLAIIGSLLLEVGGQSFALPLSSVEEAVALDDAQIRAVDGVQMITLRGRSLRLLDLGAHFGLARDEPARPGGARYAVVVSAGTARVGLVVTQLVGQQDVVIKPLGPSLSSVRGFAGAAELGDQRIALVLDAPALVEEAFSSAELRPRRELRRSHA